MRLFTPEGSASFPELDDWARYHFHRAGLKIPLKPDMPKSWRTEVDGNLYPELWIRYYAIYRHGFDCMACCSDYANCMTDEELPIVRSRKLDLRLLLAHAQIQHWVRANKNQKKKGQNNGKRTGKVTTG